MNDAADLGPVIAERILRLKPDRTVTVRLGTPYTPDDFPDESWCPYQIVGLGSSRIWRVVGIDAFQSLWLALQSIGLALYTSEEYRAGRLHLFDNDDPDLCFPVHQSCRDLLPDWPPQRPEEAGGPAA